MTVFYAALLFFSLVYATVILILFRGLRSLQIHDEDRPHTFSIVIAARNEEENIKKCLDSVLNQSIDKSRYEVIAADDRSTDATLSILQEYASRHPNLRVIHIDHIPDGISPKKHVVSQGISIAKNDIIVFTDADCVVTPGWLSAINRNFADDTGLVQGITTYSYIDGMNKMFWGLQSIDFLSHGVVAASAIGAGVPLNSNANNFAFRRNLFSDIGGYGERSARVVSGDDDLLLQRIWLSKKWKVRYMIDHDGAVSTLPTPTVRGVFEQRKRWGSKTVNYSPLQVTMLAGIFLFYLSVLAAIIAAFFSSVSIYFACGLVIMKIIGEYMLLIPGTKIFNRTDLRRYIIPASFIQLVIVVAAVFMGVFGKFNWKGQKFSREVGRKS